MSYVATPRKAAPLPAGYQVPTPRLGTFAPLTAPTSGALGQYYGVRLFSWKYSWYQLQPTAPAAASGIPDRSAGSSDYSMPATMTQFFTTAHSMALAPLLKLMLVSGGDTPIIPAPGLGPQQGGSPAGLAGYQDWQNFDQGRGSGTGWMSSHAQYPVRSFTKLDIPASGPATFVSQAVMPWDANLQQWHAWLCEWLGNWLEQPCDAGTSGSNPKYQTPHLRAAHMFATQLQLALESATGGVEIVTGYENAPGFDAGNSTLTAGITAGATTLTLASWPAGWTQTPYAAGTRYFLLRVKAAAAANSTASATFDNYEDLFCTGAVLNGDGTVTVTVAGNSLVDRASGGYPGPFSGGGIGNIGWTRQGNGALNGRGWQGSQPSAWQAGDKVWLFALRDGGTAAAPTMSATLAAQYYGQPCVTSTAAGALTANTPFPLNTFGEKNSDGSPAVQWGVFSVSDFNRANAYLVDTLASYGSVGNAALICTRDYTTGRVALSTGPVALGPAAGVTAEQRRIQAAAGAQVVAVLNQHRQITPTRADGTIEPVYIAMYLGNFYGTAPVTGADTSGRLDRPAAGSYPTGIATEDTTDLTLDYLTLTTDGTNSAAAKPCPNRLAFGFTDIGKDTANPTVQGTNPTAQPVRGAQLTICNKARARGESVGHQCQGKQGFDDLHPSFYANLEWFIGSMPDLLWLESTQTRFSTADTTQLNNGVQIGSGNPALSVGALHDTGNSGAAVAQHDYLTGYRYNDATDRVSASTYLAADATDTDSGAAAGAWGDRIRFTNLIVSKPNTI